MKSQDLIKFQSTRDTSSVMQADRGNRYVIFDRFCEFLSEIIDFQSFRSWIRLNIVVVDILQNLFGAAALQDMLVVKTTLDIEL